MLAFTLLVRGCLNIGVSPQTLRPFLLFAQKKWTKEKNNTKANLELLLVLRSGPPSLRLGRVNASGAAKLRVRTFRGRPHAWLV